MDVDESLFHFFKSHHDLFPAKARILAACSGGPDSVALLYGLKAVQETRDIEILVAHVNHGLRGKESEDDQKFVRQTARNLGWRALFRRISLARGAGGNLEEKARVKRYEALISLAREQKIHTIFTAHNLDDQAETILMNFLRGSGISGLAGMPAIRVWPGSGTKICRPFLNVSKEDIKGYLKEKKVPFRMDRMNEDQKFLRSSFRKKIAPWIEERFPGFKRRLGHFSDIVREEETFWGEKVKEMTRRLLARERGGYVLPWDEFSKFPLPLQRRFLKQVIGPDLLSFDNLEALRKWMASPPADGRIWQLKKGWFVERLSRSQGAPSARLFWLGQDGIERNFSGQKRKVNSR